METNLVESTKSSTKTMKKKLLGTTLKGYALLDRSGAKKIAKGIEILYNVPITPGSGYIGSPITQSVAEILINNFSMNPMPNLTHLDIGSDYGKNDLMAILSQPNCEKIRFYFAKINSSDFEVPTDVHDGVSLVAMGLDKDDVEIVTDIVRFKNSISVRQSLNNTPLDTVPVTQDGLIFEMVPPIRGGVKFLKSDTIEKIVLRFLKIKHF